MEAISFTIRECFYETKSDTDLTKSRNSDTKLLDNAVSRQYNNAYKTYMNYENYIKLVKESLGALAPIEMRTMQRAPLTKEIRNSLKGR